MWGRGSGGWWLGGRDRAAAAASLLVAAVLLLLPVAAPRCHAQPTAESVAQSARVAPIPLYRELCLRCHGESGAGDGPDAPFLEPPPTSFESGRFKIKSTVPGTPPTIDNVARSIRAGLPGTAMPAFGDRLDDEQIETLAAYVFTLTGRTPSRRSLRIASVPDQGEGVLVEGKKIYQRLQCADCHGEEGRGDGPEVPRLRRPDGSPEPVTDLTRPWSFKGGWQRIDVALRILSGLEGTSMEGYYDRKLHADQLYALVDYVLSLRPADDLNAAAALAAAAEPGSGATLLERGRHLTAALACDRCHTPIDEAGSPIMALRLAGGMTIDLYPVRQVIASNLTPHSTGLAGVDLAGFVRMMRTGEARGRSIDPLSMPWPHYASLTDRDLEAIFTYLESLPPVANAIPATRRFTGLDPLLYKLRALTGGPTLRVRILPGNAGNPVGRAAKPAAPADRSWLSLGGLLLIVLVIEIAILWRPAALGGRLRRRHRRRHRALRERLRGSLLVLSLLVMVGLVVVSWWPPADFGPSSKTIDMLAPALPEAAGVEGDAVVVAARGRYLVTVAACASCHTAYDPFWPLRRGAALAGGPRFAWSVFGEVRAPNLTPDAGTGLGRWQRQDVRRLLRSGLLGERRVHPAAMPWNLFGRFTDEELESILVYLESIPPVRNPLPPPSPGGGELFTIDFAAR